MKENILALLDESLATGKPVELTQRLGHNLDDSFTQKDGYAEKNITAVISSVEDMGDYYNIGYIPLSPAEGRIGHFKIHKSIGMKYGIVAVNGVEIYK